ncbi:4-hydroxy-3-methylbut-2-enyl diphosphate reductase [Ruminococcaceae bacterium FB2012]|nr:4-hydroxy-3-methylbut-2-enyl diphosphate reductase [Ruminococcaceae bacterium FB2012]
MVAKTAGFCFGVDRAVKIVYNELDIRNNVVTLGPLIHNGKFVADLESRGCRAVSLEEVRADNTVVIRSHGVAKDVFDRLAEIGCTVVDATCPFVERIHKKAAENSAEGRTVLIAGDPAHPEVQGIKGHCSGECYVFDGCEELESLVKSGVLAEKKLAILSQTTYNKKKWDECCELAARLLPQAKIYHTICSATAERQAEAAELAQKADVMVIVGGRLSSNTHKLKAVCEGYCPTYLIEGADELKGIDFSSAKIIGISAGASTPAYIIKEVVRTMSEIINNEEEFNFEEALEASLKPIHIGKRVQGTVLSVNSNEVYVDLGTKQQGIIPAAELSDDPGVKPEDVVKVGDVVDLIVLKPNDQEGIVTLSKKRVDAAVGFEKIMAAKEEGTVLTGVVTNVIKGGVLVSCFGVKVFIPASHAAPKRDFDLNSLLRQQVEFKIIEVTENKQRAVGSIKEVAKAQKAAAQISFFENTKVGDTVTGEVKSITDYGVFVDLGGVDGLVRRADLSWNRFKHPSEIVSVGDKIEVTIKDIDPETKKVALTYKKDSENPWEIFRANFEQGQVIKATVVSITSFGAFAQIINGVDGLIHISQIANKRVDNVADILKVGDEVEVKITEIDPEKKRISLSMRALLPEEEDEAVYDTEEAEAEESEETEGSEE